MAFLAPAGTPISLSDIFLGLVPTNGAAARLSQKLAEHADAEQSWLLSTGRAAMTLSLESMRQAAEGSGRNEVIIPAYTCYSVAASVIKAGLRPRLCDIDPISLSLDLGCLRRIDTTRILAIVSANLYGIPNALDEIERWARERGIYLLDDAAQALGATHAGRAVGSFGEAGIYSFDKGKNITSLEGGAIVARGSVLVTSIENRYERLATPSGATTAILAAKLIAYSLLLRPNCYGAVRKLPFLGLGRTPYDEAYPIRRYHSALAGLVLRLYGRLSALTQARTRNAWAIKEAVRETPGIDIVRVSADSVPAYARFPLLIRDAMLRESVIRNLEQAGIGATKSYPNALSDVPEIVRNVPQGDLVTPGARAVAASIVTLPTHPYCPENYADAVRRAVALAMGSSRR